MRRMKNNLSRRQILASAALAATGIASSRVAGSGENRLLVAASKPALHSAAKEIKYCLNMSTIRGQKLPLPQQVEVASKAGYQAIEPWMGELDAFVTEAASWQTCESRLKTRD